MLVESDDAFKILSLKMAVVLDEKSERIVLDRLEIKLDFQVEGIQVLQRFCSFDNPMVRIFFDGRMKIYFSLSKE